MIALLKYPDLDLTQDEVDSFIPDPYYDPSILHTIKHPRVIKSHEPYVSDYPRVIYLFRDGRNCLVSWYDMQIKLYGYNETFYEFVNNCIYGSFGHLGFWQEHVNSWILTPHDKPILKIRYEDLCNKPEQFLLKIGFFLSIVVDDKKIRKAIKGSTRQVRQDF